MDASETTFTELMSLDALPAKSEREARFQGLAAPDKGQRLFGGQLLAQSVCAAEATTTDDRTVHSLHGYFLRPGDVDLPVEYSVESVRDGRSFSSRSVIALQRNKELFRLQASFQVPAETLDYAATQMPDVPPPEAIGMTYERFWLEQSDLAHWPGRKRPMEIRYINPPGARGIPIVEDQLMWMRIRDRLPETPGLHQAGLVYLSDASVADHLMLPHGRRWQDPDFEGASLDHSMWFHRPARADEWLLFAQSVESTGAGRGLASGRFFDQSGSLIATCTQEGLMRWSDA
ncbi:MAG: thioesterase family protein [Gammaproteobacteria bacterium]|nr:thioesterase family protein [Gammaproteobacteria bacterium]